MPASGRFVAVVGPSGAGKDTLIAGARAHFGEDGPIRFIRRVITRSAGAGGEDHTPVDLDTFEAMVRDDAFALHWEAHGLRYGLPREMDGWLECRLTVVANVSRTALPVIRERYVRRTVVAVTADPEVIARRLAERGRETAGAIAARLERGGMADVDGPDVVTIDNSGAPDAAVARFVDVLSEPPASVL